MKTFKQHSDLEKLSRSDLAYPVMEKLVKVLIDDFKEPGQTYSPEDFGFLVLVEPGDTDRALTEIDMPKLTEIYWEGASMRQGFIYAVFLGTDDWGLRICHPARTRRRRIAGRYEQNTRHATNQTGGNIMSKSEDNADMKILKTGSCKSITGKSTLTYQLGCTPDNAVHIRISK